MMGFLTGMFQKSASDGKEAAVCGTSRDCSGMTLPGGRAQDERVGGGGGTLGAGIGDDSARA